MKFNRALFLLFAIGVLISCNSSKYTSGTDTTVREKTRSNDPNAWDVDGENGEVVVEAPIPTEPEAPYYGVQFQKSELLRPLLDQARQEGKIVFVDFYATWCGPCKAMDRNVFSDKRIGDYFNDNFISYKVDADGEGSHIAAIYNIKNLPTLLFLDTEGEVLARRNSAAGITELESLARRAQQLNGTSAGGGK